MTRFTALTAALILSALPVLAADPAPLKQAEASRVLYDTGVATRDPLLVLAAAKMRRGLGLSPPTAWPRMAPPATARWMPMRCWPPRGIWRRAMT